MCHHFLANLTFLDMDLSIHTLVNNIGRFRIHREGAVYYVLLAQKTSREV